MGTVGYKCDQEREMLTDQGRAMLTGQKGGCFTSTARNGGGGGLLYSQAGPGMVMLHKHGYRTGEMNQTVAA